MKRVASFVAIGLFAFGALLAPSLHHIVLASAAATQDLDCCGQHGDGRDDGGSDSRAHDADRCTVCQLAITAVDLVFGDVTVVASPLFRVTLHTGATVFYVTPWFLYPSPRGPPARV